MRCIESSRAAAGALTAAALALSACSTTFPGLGSLGQGSAPAPAPAPAPAANPAPGPASAATTPPAQAPAPGATTATRPSSGPTAATAPAAAAKAVPLAARRTVTLPPPPPARNWADFKLQAARRLVDTHPDGSYLGKPPEPLLAIPVLEVELNADGSVRKVTVLREPREAKDTIKMAIDAVRRAAPYGDVSRLSRPWKFVCVFLYDDDRRFMPAELDR